MNLVKMAKELLDIHEEIKYYTGFGEFKEDEYDIYIFEQMWGNTSGGFQGVGGSAMTNQNTYVLIPKCEGKCFVFFGGIFAYKVPYSQKFIKDVIDHNVKGIHGMGEYLKNN